MAEDLLHKKDLLKKRSIFMHTNLLTFGHTVNTDTRINYAFAFALSIFLFVSFALISRMQAMSTDVLETRLWIMTIAFGMVIGLLVYMGKRYFEDYLKKIDTVQEKLILINETQVKMSENLNFLIQRLNKVESGIENEIRQRLGKRS